MGPPLPSCLQALASSLRKHSASSQDAADLLEALGNGGGGEASAPASPLPAAVAAPTSLLDADGDDEGDAGLGGSASASASPLRGAAESVDDQAALSPVAVAEAAPVPPTPSAEELAEQRRCVRGRGVVGRGRLQDWCVGAFSVTAQGTCCVAAVGHCAGGGGGGGGGSSVLCWCYRGGCLRCDCCPRPEHEWDWLSCDLHGWPLLPTLSVCMFRACVCGGICCSRCCHRELQSELDALKATVAEQEAELEQAIANDEFDTAESLNATLETLAVCGPGYCVGCKRGRRGGAGDCAIAVPSGGVVVWWWWWTGWLWWQRGGWLLLLPGTPFRKCWHVCVGGGGSEGSCVCTDGVDLVVYGVWCEVQGQVAAVEAKLEALST